MSAPQLRSILARPARVSFGDETAVIEALPGTNGRWCRVHLEHEGVRPGAAESGGDTDLFVCHTTWLLEAWAWLKRHYGEQLDADPAASGAGLPALRDEDEAALFADPEHREFRSRRLFDEGWAPDPTNLAETGALIMVRGDFMRWIHHALAWTRGLDDDLDRHGRGESPWLDRDSDPDPAARAAAREAMRRTEESGLPMP